MALVLAGCGRKPVDATPEGVLREFLERIERVQGNPKDATMAYELLSKAAQAGLAERAKRASAALGTRVAPEQMIAPAHFFPRFQPRSWSTRVDGDKAFIQLVGLDEGAERATVPCIREEGHWRVHIALPPLPPVEKRSDVIPK
jgi:hypothetical protein